MKQFYMKLKRTRNSSFYIYKESKKMRKKEIEKKYQKGVDIDTNLV